MEYVCDFVEKCKNLVKWEESRMSGTFFFIVLILFVVVTFLPLRTIIILYLVYKFNRGRSYHKRRFRNNREVVTIELRNFMEDQKLAHLLTDLNQKWEVLLKGQYTKSFQEKLLSYL
mmetsp:Transcript_18155/g.13205  ORF Transcript_18155/g.13205 Transcript_18155/m.13205 type:complete len:117 (+) Transcript_18155:1041-1391(+)